ncbi:RNA polymerase sigma factor [Enemella sp. A6]|uniref:RNA polymerase sigma factor n=1 Tax=Enemella sp. A6 TaxID=3440152 RepID=UPI003EBCD5C4
MADSAHVTLLRIEDVLREQAPHVLGALVRRFGRFELAEDAVQEALLIASQRWPEEGIPDEPRSWLIRVGYRKMVDLIRSEQASHRREQDVAHSDPVLVDPTQPAPVIIKHDDSLYVLLLCCHPSLSEVSQVALTLRAVGGLTTEEIANAYGSTVTTMGTRISRAKQTLKKSGARFHILDDEDLAGRVAVAMRILYLIFNEGYTATGGDRLTRIDLTTEAIRLTRMLHNLLPDEPEVAGLLALMLLTEARRDARTDLRERLIALPEQDRSRWNRSMITEGRRLIDDAWGRERIGPYQLQAAIASTHTQAVSAQTTDWPQIAALYLWLERLLPTAPVRLGRVVAVAEAFGPRRGLALLDQLDRDHRLTEDPLIRRRTHAVRAHLLDRIGDRDRAAVEYRIAAELTTNDVERRYLFEQIKRQGESTP